MCMRERLCVPQCRTRTPLNVFFPEEAVGEHTDDRIPTEVDSFTWC